MARKGCGSGGSGGGGDGSQALGSGSSGCREEGAGSHQGEEEAQRHRAKEVGAPATPPSPLPRPLLARPPARFACPSLSLPARALQSRDGGVRFPASRSRKALHSPPPLTPPTTEHGKRNGFFGDGGRLEGGKVF